MLCNHTGQYDTLQVYQAFLERPIEYFTAKSLKRDG
jgi:hypothetical protein